VIEEVVRGRVAWVETDAGRLIHFTNAFRWAEEAETTLRRRLGQIDAVARSPRRHVEAEFIRPLRFEDEYETRIWLDALGRTSLTWAFEITSGGELCIRGRMVVVNIDEDGRPAPIPEAERAALSV
jgi:acyl-CoA thioester hydrolase